MTKNTTDLVITETSKSLETVIAAAQDYAANAKSSNTRRAYRSDWAGYEGWCHAQGCEGLPAAPEVLAVYLSHLASSGRKVSTIERGLAAISEAHRAAGHASPRASAVVRSVMQGIRRKHGTAPSQKAPLLVEDLRRLVAALPDSLIGLRDRALLLVGFAAALRRSELVALDICDVISGSDGRTITLRRSKTDQEGLGRQIGVPYGSDPATCPVRALDAWIAAAGITEGAIFHSVSKGGLLGDRLSDREIARIVKKRASAVGLDAARLAGHSLRAGLATSAAKAGKSERAIMAQTGHRSVAMVRRYVRNASLFVENAASGIGL